MTNVDLIQRLPDEDLWRLSDHFEYSGPTDCRVGRLCGRLEGVLLTKDQVLALGLCRARPLSLAAPGGPGCRHRLVPTEREMGELFGLTVLTIEELVHRADLDAAPGTLDAALGRRPAESIPPSAAPSTIAPDQAERD
jgi:hypothetical protein